MVDSKPLSIDLLIGDSNVGITGAEIREGSRVAVQWNNGSAESLYPMIMLRDCCPCEKCFNPIVNSRLTLFEQLMASACEVKNISHKVVIDSIHIIYNSDYYLSCGCFNGKTTPFFFTCKRIKGIIYVSFFNCYFYCIY